MTKWSQGKRISGLSAILLLAVTAFLTRLLPLHFSPYPFNNDALGHSGIAEEILNSGHLEFSEEAPWAGSYSTKIPILNTLLAFISSSLGVYPIECAQVMIAMISMLTVCSLFLLGKAVSGSLAGGIASGLTAAMLGTLVFTTGSVWGMALGLSLFSFSVFTYVSRARFHFRIVTSLVLIVLPLVHHLVAFVAIIAFSYLVIWSVVFACWSKTFGKRHWLDLTTIAIPVLATPLYYVLVSFGRLSLVSSEIAFMILASLFALFGLVSIWILMPRRHISMTFAPVVAVMIVFLLIADYQGYVFEYTSSASNLYILLVFAMALTIGLAWYGAEMTLVYRVVYRAIPVSLLMAPLAVIAFALSGGSSPTSFQLVYRSFDLFDIFLAVGVGTALAVLGKRRHRMRLLISVLLIIALVVSFPFGYWTDQLLGVRHDTQEYEVDALSWIRRSSSETKVISDERLSHIAHSMFWFTKDASLPGYMMERNSIGAGWTCMAEESWMTSGVNFFPRGKLIIAQNDFQRTLLSSDVIYIGGPKGDAAVVFVGSSIGQMNIYGAVH